MPEISTLVNPTAFMLLYFKRENLKAHTEYTEETAGTSQHKSFSGMLQYRVSISIVNFWLEK